MDLREEGLTDGQAAPFVDFYARLLDFLTYYDAQTG